ncbi:MAG: hypothetical protein IKQ61_06585 [Spirochaetales bacterium]|nr:hypothetical protein [Spirochaetales bacterium]
MKPQEEKNEAEKKTVIQQTCEIGTIVYDYNPRKAGAKIVRRVDAPKGYYVTRTNGHYYMITADKIIIFDIRYNKMKIIREIPYQLEQLCPNVDKDFLHVMGILQINDKIYFGLYTDIRGLQYDSKRELVISFALADESPRFSGILSLNDDGVQLCYADITADLSDEKYMRQIYYDEISRTLTIFCFTNTRKILCYKYNIQTKSFEKTDEKTFRDYGVSDFIRSIYFTDKYYITQRLHFHFNALLVENYIDILFRGETEIFKTINLFHLGIHYPLLSAFSDDDGNIWLYVREYDSQTKQDKYELLKLKLLE